MANVQVIQRNAHLAGAVKLEVVNGREGKIARAVLTAISNTRRGSGPGREDEVTAIHWTLWGKQAENAAAYLSKGSHVNIVGHIRNNNYKDAEGADVYALAFTGELVDYLDSKADSEGRRMLTAVVPVPQAQPSNSIPKTTSRARKARTEPQGEAVPA